MGLAKLAAVTIFLSSISSVAFADGPIEAGKTKANQMCVSCHGADGISPSDQWPNLAGQKAPYLAKQLKAFKDKTRTDPMMGAMAMSLTDDDISNLAAYYSSLK